MTRKQMWMGTRGYEMWVPAPAASMPRGRVGFTSEMQLLRGGISVERSMASHGEWALTWPNLRAEDLAKIEAMASGLYDTEDNGGLIYFVDPMAAYTNVLPPDWATPGLADAMPLIQGQEPTIAYEAPSTFGYPARSAVYDVTTAAKRILYVPIPPGHRLVIGAHGSTPGSGNIRVTPFKGAVAQGATTLPWLGRDSSQLTSHSFGGTDITGVEIRVSGVAADVVTLNALVARILPGVPAAIQTGPFMPGRGAGGCAFAAHPAETALSAALDLSTFTARLVEVEPWL